MSAGARAGAGAALLAAIVAAACVSEHPEPTGPGGPEADCLVPVGLGGALVPISDFRFFPDTIRVRAGTRVAWVNCDPAPIEPHTATADGGAFDSGLLTPATPGEPGGAFAADFPTAGSFPYHCAVHPFMTGVVLVE